MLRAVVIAVAAILACTGVALIAHGVPAPGWQALGIGLVLLIGTLFERWRYRRLEDVPRGDWQSTGERFVDPSTGEPVQVLFNPHTGERRYVPDNAQGTPDSSP